MLSSYLPIGYKDDFKILANDSIPLILSSIIQIFLPIISVPFCGYIGTNELDAASLSTAIINMAVFTNVYGLTSACDTLFPQIFGGEDKKKLGLVLQKGIIISCMSSFLSAALLLSAKPIMNLVIKEPEIIVLTDTYLVTFIPSIFFYSISTLISKYLQSQNIIYPPMFINLIAIILNIILHSIFIIGLNMGVKGAALSVNISTFFLAFILFLYVYFSKVYIQTWPGWTYDCMFEWSEYLKLGVPGCIAFLIDLSYFEVGTFAAGIILLIRTYNRQVQIKVFIKIGNVGKIELGVMTITQEILFICFQIPFGIGIAGNIYIGQLLGANLPEKAKNATKVTFLISGLCSFVLFLIVFNLSSVLPLLFSNDHEILKMSDKLLKFVALIHILDGTQGMCCGLLRAVGAQFYSSVVMFFSFYVIGASTGLVLLLKTTLQVWGFYIGIFFAELVLVSLQVLYITKINWKKMAQNAYESNKSVNNGLLYNENEISNEYKLVRSNSNYDAKEKANYRIRKDLYFQGVRILLGFLSCFTIFLLSIYGRYLINQ